MDRAHYLHSECLFVVRFSSISRRAGGNSRTSGGRSEGGGPVHVVCVHVVLCVGVQEIVKQNISRVPIFFSFIIFFNDCAKLLFWGNVIYECF